MYKTNAKEFRECVKAKLTQTNPSIKEEDLYFSQTTMTYILDYKPKYPEKSNGDFTVYQDVISGKISLHGNFDALIPTIIKFDSLTDFKNRYGIDF